ncbi:MAG: phospho-N-acetylmuramoyl-pentapeptide-transferase [Deinococcaceae bacterium]
MEIALSTLLAWFLVGLYRGLARRNGWGQTVRQDGPETHHVKSGTPNMGGVPLVIAILVTWVSLPISDKFDFRELVLLASVVLMAAIGFVDDWIKVRDRQKGRPSDGLHARYKLAFQLLVAVGFGVCAAKISPLGVPGWGPFFDAPLYATIMLAAVNAFNFTDGLDGLLGGVAVLVLLPILWVSPLVGIAVGATLGFLWYNLRPASVFMGDTGSFALGAVAAAGYILYDWTWSLPVVAIVPVLEVLSVFLQVGYFRQTGGKRLFLMTPLHHHFEKKGMPEEKITGRFWLLTAVAVAMVWSFKGLP